MFITQRSTPRAPDGPIFLNPLGGNTPLHTRGQAGEGNSFNPVQLVTYDGTVLEFVTLMTGSNDYTQYAIGVKRSVDGGATFLQLQVIVGPNAAVSAVHRFSNAAPVQDVSAAAAAIAAGRRPTIWVEFGQDSDGIRYDGTNAGGTVRPGIGFIYSTDDGVTWQYGAGTVTAPTVVLTSANSTLWGGNPASNAQLWNFKCQPSPHAGVQKKYAPRKDYMYIAIVVEPLSTAHGYLAWHVCPSHDPPVVANWVIGPSTVGLDESITDGLTDKITEPAYGEINDGGSKHGWLYFNTKYNSSPGKRLVAWSKDGLTYGWNSPNFNDGKLREQAGTYPLPIFRTLGCLFWIGKTMCLSYATPAGLGTLDDRTVGRVIYSDDQSGDSLSQVDPVWSTDEIRVTNSNYGYPSGVALSSDTALLAADTGDDTNFQAIGAYAERSMMWKFNLAWLKSKPVPEYIWPFNEGLDAELAQSGDASNYKMNTLAELSAYNAMATIPSGATGPKYSSVAAFSPGSCNLLFTSNDYALACKASKYVFTVAANKGFTYECRFLAAVGAVNMCLFGNDTANPHIHCLIDGAGKASMVVHDGTNTDTVTSTGVVATGRWMYARFVIDPATKKLYVYVADGSDTEVVNSTDYTAHYPYAALQAATPAEVRFGRLQDGSKPFVGRIDCCAASLKARVGALAGQMTWSYVKPLRPARKTSAGWANSPLAWSNPPKLWVPAGGDIYCDQWLGQSSAKQLGSAIGSVRSQEANLRRLRAESDTTYPWLHRDAAAGGMFAFNVYTPEGVANSAHHGMQLLKADGTSGASALLDFLTQPGARWSIAFTFKINQYVPAGGMRSRVFANMAFASPGITVHLNRFDATNSLLAMVVNDGSGIILNTEDDRIKVKTGIPYLAMWTWDTTVGTPLSNAKPVLYLNNLNAAAPDFTSRLASGITIGDGSGGTFTGGVMTSTDILTAFPLTAGASTIPMWFGTSAVQAESLLGYAGEFAFRDDSAGGGAVAGQADYTQLFNYCKNWAQRAAAP